MCRNSVIIFGDHSTPTMAPVSDRRLIIDLSNLILRLPKYQPGKRQSLGLSQPLPVGLFGPACESFSMYSMILLAISMPVAFSMPSSPGEELTSITNDP